MSRTKKTKRKADDASGLPWLDALEERVSASVEALAALGAENRRLTARIEELEAVAAESAGEEKAVGEDSAEAAEWRRERRRVRDRVGKLTATLEGLLTETDTEADG